MKIPKIIRIGGIDYEIRQDNGRALFDIAERGDAFD